MNARLASAAAVALIAIAGCGGGSDTAPTKSAAPARTIEVTMNGYAFDPSSVTVARGETVRFTFKNADTKIHEAIIGADAAQKQHETEMATPMGHGSMSGMGATSDTDAVEVQPGQTGTLTHTFDTPGTLLMGCHEPGHYASGMKAPIAVT